MQNSIYCMFASFFFWSMLLMCVWVQLVVIPAFPHETLAGITRCHLLKNSPRLICPPAVLLVFSVLIYSFILFTLNPSLMLMRGASSSDRACGPSLHSTPLQTPWVISHQRPVCQTHSCQSLSRQEVVLRGPIQRHWFHWLQTSESVWSLQRA